MTVNDNCSIQSFKELTNKKAGLRCNHDTGCRGNPADLGGGAFGKCSESPPDKVPLTFRPPVTRGLAFSVYKQGILESLMSRVARRSLMKEARCVPNVCAVQCPEMTRLF
jgi:hypothetical protein